jgi:Domain of unknown function (DUF222)/HNH endonuclease
MTDLDTAPDINSNAAPHDTADALSLDELESRMCLLAGRIAAHEREFLLLLAEYDERQGWGVWEFRSAAHWLSARCGMRLGAARERVRVARALTLLPRVSKAFAAGQLSYCKVRALSRVATPTTEETLVELARGATGAQLERIVRSWRTVLTEDLAATQRARRSVRRREADDGSVVFVLRLPPEDAAVLDSALRAARAEVLDDDGRPVETPEELRLAEELSRDEPEKRADADAFVLMAERFLGQPPAADKPKIYQVVIHADAAMFDEAERHSEPPADEPVRVRKPKRRDGTHTQRGGPHLRRGQSITEAARLAGAPGATVEDGGQVSGATVLRLLCEASAQVWLRDRDGRTLDLGRTARDASRKQRRALQLRDGGCRFPGCTRQTHLIPHHVQWWSRRGATDLDNLVLLCSAHHRAVHEVGYSITNLGRGCFVFLRPDGRVVPDAAERSQPPDGAYGADGAPYVDPHSIVPTWGGERLDLRLLISGMACNVLNAGGYSLLDTPSRDLPAAIRAAAEWPLKVERRRDSERDRQAA